MKKGNVVLGQTKEKLKAMMKIDYRSFKLKLLSLLMPGNGLAVSSSLPSDESNKFSPSTEDVRLSGVENRQKNPDMREFEKGKVVSNIRLYLFPFGSDDNVVSHAALEYSGQIIDYSSRGFSKIKSLKHQKECYVYEIDPYQAGIDINKLETAINKRKKEIKGRDYNYLTENCADQIVAVLKEAGAKDVKKALGISVPMLDGLPSLDDWAEKYGTLVQTPLKEVGKTNFIHYVKALSSKRPPKTIKFIEDRAKVRNCIQAMCYPEQYKKEIKQKCKTKCANGKTQEMLHNAGYSDHILGRQDKLQQQKFSKPQKKVSEPVYNPYYVGNQNA